MGKIELFALDTSVAESKGKFSWEVCGFPKMRDNKIDSNNKLTATKYQISLSLYTHLKTVRLDINKSICMYMWYCDKVCYYLHLVDEWWWDCPFLKVLYTNNLIFRNRIYFGFGSGDTFLLKSNRIRMFNTTCKTRKTLWIIHFRFYLSRASNYLNWSKCGVQ